MSVLNVKATGCALGVTAAVLYAACVLAMRILPHDVFIQLFNSLMHGMDVTSIMRWDIPWWESLLGLLGFAFLGWLAGCLYALVYNRVARKT